HDNHGGGHLLQTIVYNDRYDSNDRCILLTWEAQRKGTPRVWLRLHSVFMELKICNNSLVHHHRVQKKIQFHTARVTNGAIVIHTQRLKSDPGGNLLS
ncbi:hypothetical protein, partial [Escherichia coli]|uniref:hypothetical protein n=1 Tax=Escherichia coli TaxID=562 RepID=UPI001B7D8531